MASTESDARAPIDPQGVPPHAFSALLSVSVALSASLDLPTVLQAAVENACELLRLETGAVYLVESETMRLGATTPPLPHGFPEELRVAALGDHPHVGRALSSMQPIYLDDFSSAPLSPAERSAAETRGLRSLLFIPLILEDEPTGVMILGTTGQTRKFDDTMVELARIFASQAAVAIANARLHESERHANAEVRRINENLEQLVQERTDDLACANEELQAQAEELQCQAIELEERALELEEANDAKARFLRSMSHELRTPLNSIIGFSGMMLQGLAGEITDEQRVQLQMVSSAGKHLLAIMNDLLDLCRIDAGTLRVSVGPIDVPNLVEECVRTVTPSIGDKDLALSTALPAQCPPLTTDAVRLRQILLNLLDNAVKFTSDGKVRIEVVYPDEENVEFTVSDTGPGIPADKLETVFGEFEQVLADRDRTIEGTGLGLAVSRGLAIALGGSLSAESKPGSGSRFTLAVPRVLDPLLDTDTA